MPRESRTLGSISAPQGSSILRDDRPQVQTGDSVRNAAGAGRREDWHSPSPEVSNCQDLWIGVSCDVLVAS